MSKVNYLGNENFATEVENANGAVVVDFTASWCPPCKMLAPIFERVAGAYEGKAKFFKVDIDQNVETSAKYGVQSIPNLLFFKDGQVVDQHVGMIPEGQLTSKVESILG
ncbi:MAG: thioredoxin [Armatimonadetes bacterium]|nr:thioredoxin [Armatimonadota bacterium]